MLFVTLDETIPVLVFRLIVSPIAIIGNGIILYITLRFKQFRTSICNCLIGLLALGEFFVGIGITVRGLYTFYLASTNAVQFDRFSCMLIAFPEIFGIIFGQIVMLSMALDRFFAVRKPIEYYHSTSKKRVYVTISIAFVLACLFSWLSLFNLENTPALQCSSGAAATHLFAVSWASFGAVIAIFVFAVYSATVYLLKKRTQAFATNDQNMNVSLHLQHKVFKSISLVLLSYGLFWCLPLFIGIIIEGTSMDPLQLGYISLVIGLFSGINSCIGIFIYLASHQELTEYFKKISPTCIQSKTNTKVENVFICHRGS